MSSENFESISSNTPDNISFICLLEEDVPKKIYEKRTKEWVLIDQFSGYFKTNEDSFPKSLVDKKIITVEEFIKNN